MALDAETESFLNSMRALPSVDPDSIPLEQFRAGIERFKPLDFDFVDLASVRDLPAGQGRPVPVRIYQPTVGSVLPVLVWAHGGSWVRGDLDSHDGTMRTIAKVANCAVVSVDYRRSPEVTYPTPLEDVYDSVAWVARNCEEYGWDPTRIAVGGDSSGGTLAAGVAQLARERSQFALALQVLLVPVLDLALETESWKALGSGEYVLSRGQLQWAASKYAPGHDVRTAPLSPLRASTFEGLPQALIVIGEFDPCRDDGISYGRKLRDAGVDVLLEDSAGMIHHALLAPQAISLAVNVLNQTARTIHNLLSSDSDA